MKIAKAERFIDYLAIVAAPIALGALILSWSPARNFAESDPSANGYVAPRDLGNIISKSQDSTVIVECEQKKGSFGSGWAIDKKNLNFRLANNNSSFIITAQHVVRNCLNSKKLNIYSVGSEKPMTGYLVSWNKEKDLALISTQLKLKPLKISNWSPLEGYWVMAIGAPEAYEASVTIGYVMNYTNEDLFFTAQISEGSSGGPLVDNEGNVVGTVTASAIGADFNIATSLENMCDGFIVCD